MAIDIGQATDGILAIMPPSKYSPSIIQNTFRAFEEMGLDKKLLKEIGSGLYAKIIEEDNKYPHKTKFWYARDISRAVGLDKTDELGLGYHRRLMAMAIAKNKRDIQNYKKRYCKEPPCIRKETAKIFKEALGIMQDLADRIRQEDNHSKAVLNYLHK